MTSEHAAGVTGDHAVDIDKQVRIYITVFVALMALTVVTVAVSYLDLPPAMAITVALFVATIKGSLVACYFMHLKQEMKALKLTVVLPFLFPALYAVVLISEAAWRLLG